MSEEKLVCHECGSPVKLEGKGKNRRYYCNTCERTYNWALLESGEEVEVQDAVDRWLGRLLLVKYAGFGIFALSLVFFLLSSLLQMVWLQPWLQNILFFGLILIIVGIIGEKVLTQ